MNWGEIYPKGDSSWNKGVASPPMKQYLERNAVRGRALVPGCGHGHEVALAVEHGLDATGLDMAPTGIPEACAGLNGSNSGPGRQDLFGLDNLFR